MTEVSGLPFGLMGEMLQDGGHPYRGMLYGMTARKYGEVDPRPVWGMMNDFGISRAHMLGYWLADAPVRTGNERILATTYVREGKVLVALASWSDRNETVTLEVDWEALGLAPGSTARAPGVEGLPSRRGHLGHGDRHRVVGRIGEHPGEGAGEDGLVMHRWCLE